MQLPHTGRTLRTVAAWLAAVVLTTATVSVVQTQFNLAALHALGADISMGTRLLTTRQDLVGFTPSFGPLAAVGLLIAFLATRGLRVWLTGLHASLYALAGAVAVLTILLALNAAFGITPVAAARGLAGLASLTLCGALGGWLFARLLPRPDNAAA